MQTGVLMQTGLLIPSQVSMMLLSLMEPVFPTVHQLSMHQSVYLVSV